MPDSQRLDIHVEIRRATPADLRAPATWSSNVEESVDTWPEPMPDGTLEPVDHPAWVMLKELA